MRRGALLLLALVALPALAQELPEITPEETAAAVAAIEAAALSDTAYRNLWCAGSLALRHTAQTMAAEPGAAQRSAAARDALYREAAVELQSAGLAEEEFTALAESVYAVVVSQTRSGGTALDFTEDDCAAAAAVTPSL
jgi:hypothetical protein